MSTETNGSNPREVANEFLYTAFESELRQFKEAIQQGNREETAKRLTLMSDVISSMHPATHIRNYQQKDGSVLMVEETFRGVMVSIHIIEP